MKIKQTKHDTDNPAIWIHPTDPAQSLVIGTDKNEDGALYVYTMDGKIDEQKTVRGLKRPNNVDVEFGEDLRAPMGVALYKRPSDGAVFVVVGRKDLPPPGRAAQSIFNLIERR